MKRIMKKAIAVLLTLVIVLSVASVASFAANGGAISGALANTSLAPLISLIKDFIAMINEVIEFINNGMPGLPFGDMAI